MSSPDLTPYIDPPLADLDAQLLFERSIDLARARLPGWVPREANTEVVLLQALALQVSELAYVVQQMPGALTQAVLGRLFEVTRDSGAPPVGRVRFDLGSNPSGREVPPGTRVQLDVGGDAPLIFTTDATLAIPPGVLSGSVAVTATEVTTAANGREPGARFDLIDSLAFVDAVVLDELVTGGRDPEGPEAYLNRGVTRLRRLVSTLVLPDHFALAALSDPSVQRAQTVDMFNPSGGAGVGLDAGHISVAALGADGLPLSADAKERLSSELQEQTASFLTVHVIDPTVTAVDVAVTVHPLPGAEPADVQGNVRAALETYLDPGTWPWAAIVRRFELVALISNEAAGVDYVVSLTTPAGDVNLLGAAPLATLGSVQVDVV